MLAFVQQWQLMYKNVTGMECQYTGEDQDYVVSYSAKKMKFSIKDFFSKCEQIRRKLQIRSHLLKKSFMENFIFCAV